MFLPACFFQNKSTASVGISLTFSKRHQSVWSSAVISWWTVFFHSTNYISNSLFICITYLKRIEPFTSNQRINILAWCRDFSCFVLLWSACRSYICQLIFSRFFRADGQNTSQSHKIKFPANACFFAKKKEKYWVERSKTLNGLKSLTKYSSRIFLVHATRCIHVSDINQNLYLHIYFFPSLWNVAFALVF